MLGKARKFTDNTHLADSLKITISAVVPFLVLMPYAAFDWAFAAAIGAMLTAPVDIPSNKKDKIIGLLVGAFTVPAVIFTLSITDGSWYFYPIFVFIFFSLSMISVYGHRANMLSFTGLLAGSLGLAHSYEGKDLLIHCLMLLLGGLFYLVVSLVFNLIRPKRYVVLQTSECMELTAEYLKHRGQLWDIDADVQKITEDQLNIQVNLNEVHENLRDYLVRNKANTGNSSNNRRLLVAFSTLVEIHEVAVSTSFEHSKLHDLFKSNPEIIKAYQKLAFHFADTIDHIAYTINLSSKYKPKYNLSQELADIQLLLDKFVKEGESSNMVEAVVMFSNVLHYAENQIDKIHTLEKTLTEKAFVADVEERFKDLEKFLTPVHYRFETLKENLNFTSTIFRHALRLTLTILVGLIVSKFFGLLNGYWILLTIVVIMRPGFGLTKQRSFERVIGTIVGGLLAIGLLYIIPNATVIAYITVLTMIIGYWFSHTDYKVGVTFITMYVVLIYGLLTPNFMDVMIYRIIDTIIGALLAFGANYLLWPSWEFLNLNTHLKKSIEANKEYVKEITLYYNEKGEVTLPYKLARKYAFIEIGNLMASFQRMIQEPKSKQKYRTELYELAVLNHTFLSTAASIGIYVQSHTTTKASEAFNVVMDYTIGNLKQTIALLEDYNNENITIIERSENFNLSISYLKGIREYELKKTYSDDKQIQDLMEESVLVIEQLIWLSSLSEKIFKITASIATMKHKEETELSMLSSLRKKIIP
ncbi:FUSC family protein [Myroides sp. M-43]|uniref:FUSC family protein n=1 Tax=Myroides oncorhynchi TaxID=2893756 RepID=UPI001E40C190|nr:FUSC family membrane protein [Myroides oncorhynchi]MCC9043928.1 FUSC family protein [Myroides oncorhynchi]